MAVTDSGRGLMAFWSSIAPVHQLAFQRWHNCEHIPERVSTPGFLRGRRYRSVQDPERFLMFYETRDAQVLSSPAYLAALNAPTRRTREALGWFRTSTRSVFTLAHDAGTTGAWPAPVLVVARLAAGRADALDVRLQALAASGPFTRARHYRSAGASRSGSTNESAIHGAGTGAPDDLLMLDSVQLDLLDGDDAQARTTTLLADILGGAAMTGAALETFSLDFALDSPSNAASDSA